MFPNRSILGGAPFNVARHLKAFKQNPVLITRLGSDTLGEEVLNEMVESGMETVGVQCCKRYPTGRVQVHLVENSHTFDILPEQAYDYIHPAVVRMITLSSNPALVYFGTLAQRLRVSSRALKNVNRSTCAPKFLDVNLRAPWYEASTIESSLHEADIAKLNEEEFAEIAQILALEGEDKFSQARTFVRQFNLDQIIVTSGESGAWQLNGDGKKTQSAASRTPIKLVDTVGAGDGFAAVYMLGAMQRWPVAKILERANAFAAAICEIRGAVPDHNDFYDPFLQDWGV